MSTTSSASGSLPQVRLRLLVPQLPPTPAGFFRTPFVVGLFSPHWCMMRMAWVALDLIKHHVAFASLLGTAFSGAELDALFGLVTSLGMTAEEMMEFHELWLTELEAESPGEHAVVLQRLGEGKDVLEAVRYIYAKRGGVAVQRGAAAFEALPKDRAEALCDALWTELTENSEKLSQSAGGRFKGAAKGAAVRAGMSGGDASSAATGAALQIGHATFAFSQAAKHGLPPPQTLAEAVRAGAQARGERRLHPRLVPPTRRGRPLRVPASCTRGRPRPRRGRALLHPFAASTNTFSPIPLLYPS